MNRKYAALQQRGFTLTELMITVAIIGVLAAFLAPSVSRYMHRNKGRAAANDVAGVLRQARNQAMGAGQVVFVTLDIGSENGTVVAARNAPTGCDGANPAPTCFSQSCADASTRMADNKALADTNVDLTVEHPDMQISGFNLSGDTLTSTGSTIICFAPDGRVLDAAGLPFSSSCDGINARIFVQDAQGALGDHPLNNDNEMSDCLDDNSEDDQQAQKDERDVANFFVIQVPFNGSISVEQ